MVTPKKLYLPALSILATVLILLIIIGISTFRNLDRQKQVALELVRHQGLTLLQAIEASVHNGTAVQSRNAGALVNFVAELSTNRNIAYIILFDSDGTILHQTGSENGPARDHPGIRPGLGEQETSRMYRHSSGDEIYEIAKPLSERSNGAQVHRPRVPDGNSRLPDQPVHFIAIGMKMAAFEEARQADLNHAVMMAIIALALGTGAAFFIFVIQNYYLVNRTLRQTQDYMHQIISSMATGLVGIDANGTVKSYNLPALALLDITEEAIKGKRFDTILDFAATGISDTLACGRSILEREIDYRTAAGRSLPLAVSVTPIRNPDGTCRGAVILLRDLSEIKTLEAHMRRSEKLAAVGALAASVAHEIRNPLSSIKGFAQFLQKSTPKESPEREYTGTMIQEVDRINAVVNDLLIFARPIQADPETTDAAELVAHVIRLVQQDANEKGITIESRIKPGVHNICLDANQITQALLNLALNAVAAVDEDGRITFGIDHDDGEGAYRIWVQDNGPGIDPKIVDKVFDPFFTTREKGTGLGLAIVRKIVESSNGQISVMCPPPDSPRGCRFVMQLPLAMEQCRQGPLVNDSK
ncbi:MAG: PAS domain-containing protein [Desulfobacteraceae bacterium]|nr:MAG: PAS domain-containing protein [Desulfobacteraceae bacterium]